MVSQTEEKIDPLLGLIGKDILEIKNKLHELEMKSAVIEEKIRNK